MLCICQKLQARNKCCCAYTVCSRPFLSNRAANSSLNYAFFPELEIRIRIGTGSEMAHRGFSIQLGLNSIKVAQNFVKTRLLKCSKKSVRFTELELALTKTENDKVELKLVNC